MSDIIFSYASDCTIGCGDFVLSICSHLLFTWKYKVTFSAKYRLDVLVGSEYGQVWWLLKLHDEFMVTHCHIISNFMLKNFHIKIKLKSRERALDWWFI